MRDIRRHHLVDPSYRPFDERGVSAAIRKASSSTAHGTDGLTVLHLRHLGEYGLAFLTSLQPLTLLELTSRQFGRTLIIPILKAGKPYDQGRSYSPISLLCPGSEDTGADPTPVLQEKHWVHAPTSMASNWGTRSPRSCSPFRLG